MGAGLRKDPAKWEHWRRLFDDWDKSGLSGAAYCRRNNITYYQFKDWQKKLRREEAETAKGSKADSSPSVVATKTRIRSELLTRREAARYLGVAEQTLAVWKTSGRYSLPVVKVGRLSKYRRADLDAFLNDNTSTPDGAESRRQAMALRAVAIAKSAELQKRQESIEFAEVKVTDRADELRPDSPEGHLEIILRGGITLRLTAGSPVDLLSSVISLLENH